MYFAARRAVLEDHAAALSFVEHLDAQDLFAAFDEDAAKNVKWALDLLKRSATGEVTLMKEMRELDNRLGLNPKAMADLRWSIGEASEPVVLAEVKPISVKDPRAA